MRMQTTNLTRPRTNGGYDPNPYPSSEPLQVGRFFDLRHPNRFRIYNLCIERDHDVGTVFQEKVPQPKDNPGAD